MARVGPTSGDLSLAARSPANHESGTHDAFCPPAKLGAEGGDAGGTQASRTGWTGAPFTRVTRRTSSSKLPAAMMAVWGEHRLRRQPPASDQRPRSCSDSAWTRSADCSTARPKRTDDWRRLVETKIGDVEERIQRLEVIVLHPSRQPCTAAAAHGTTALSSSARNNLAAPNESFNSRIGLSPDRLSAPPRCR